MPEVTPYNDPGLEKKEQVEKMFDHIAPRYDFLNHFLSLGIDRIWRRRTISRLKAYSPKRILDVATGTGDLAIAALRLQPDRVTGLDLSAAMLEAGREKLKKKGLSDSIELIKGDSENLPFDKGSFDAVTAAFGVRNFGDLDRGLAEMYRVLDDKGAVSILEFSKPAHFPLKQLYNFYFSRILPGIGNKLSRDASAYTYLPESVGAFPDGEVFLAHLKKAGFTKVLQKRLSFGIATIYTGKKELKQ